ncbi:MAG: response regulator [Elusimicrobia bacterium]|nr:response regulator [Elusimicrobiota bacterium]
MTAKILIVDDEEDIRRTLALLLGDDYEVLCAGGGEEALRTLAREQPEVMLLDITMPGLSGLDVLAVKAEAAPKTTVVMLTSKADIEFAQRALQLGAVSYVTKPFDHDFLREEIARILKAASGEEDPYRPWRTE